MPRQEIRSRLVDTLTYEASRTRSIEVPRTGKIRSLSIRNAGTLTVAGASNTAAATLRGDEWAYLTDIALRINGDTILRKWSANELRFYQYLMSNAVPDLTAAIGDGATLNPTFDSLLEIPLLSPRMRRPWDTLLEAQKFSRVDVDFTFGTHLSINAAATALSATVELNVLENVGGPESEDPQVLNHPLTEITRQTETVTGVSAAYRAKLPVGEQKVYERFIIQAQTAAGVDSSTMITSMKLKSGSTEIYSSKFLTALKQMRTRWGLPSGWDPSAGTYNRFSRSTSVHQDGWVVVDLCTDGLATEGIDASDLSELNFEFETSAACTINIFPICRKQR